MKLEGIKKACSATKACDPNGYGLVCHIYLRGNKVYANLYTANTMIRWWERDYRPDAEFYARTPMTMAEIEDRLNKKKSQSIDDVFTQFIDCLNG